MGNTSPSNPRASTLTIGDGATSETTRCSTRRTPSTIDCGISENNKPKTQRKTVKLQKKDLRRLLDDYCTRSYGSHSTMTSVDHYYQEIFQYQRKIDSIELVRKMGTAVAQGKALEAVMQEFVKELQIKKTQAFESALERSHSCQVGVVAQSGMLDLCPKADKSAWRSALQRTLDEEYDDASDEALSILGSYVAADAALVQKLDEGQQRQAVFWEKELETLFAVWQEATSFLLDQTYTKNEVFEELDTQARLLAEKLSRKLLAEKSDDRMQNLVKKPLLARSHDLLADVTARLLQLELWEHAHGLSHARRTQLIQVLVSSLRDKVLLGRLLFSTPLVEELAKVSNKNGKVWRLEDSVHGNVIVDSARAYFETLIRKNHAPPPVVDLFPSLLRATHHGLLAMCAKAGNHFWLHELFRAGADPLEQTAEGTPAQIAQHAGRHAIVSEIQNYLIEVDTANHKLLEACFDCDVREVQRQLLGRGTVNCMTAENWTPLHIAAYVGSATLVRLLLDETCDVNAIDKQGWTSLHICVENKRIDIVMLLMEVNASVDLRDVHGNSPVDLALRTKDECLIDAVVTRATRFDSDSSVSKITPLLD